MFVLTDSPIPIDIIDDSITRIFDTSNGSTMIVDGDVTRTLLIEATAATVGLGTVRGTIVFSMAATTSQNFDIPQISASATNSYARRIKLLISFHNIAGVHSNRCHN
jgi:hypothetical protein